MNIIIKQNGVAVFNRGGLINDPVSKLLRSVSSFHLRITIFFTLWSFNMNTCNFIIHMVTYYRVHICSISCSHCSIHHIYAYFRVTLLNLVHSKTWTLVIRKAFNGLFLSPSGSTFIMLTNFPYLCSVSLFKINGGMLDVVALMVGATIGE